MNNIFYVHSWRTFLLSSLIIDLHHISPSSVLWVASRGFDSILESLGYPNSNIFRVSPSIFNGPYSYRHLKQNYSEIRSIAIELRGFARGKTHSLYLPHFRDPWMQLAASAFRPDQLHYIEEGNAFTRTQSDNSLQLTDLILDDPGVNNYFPSIFFSKMSSP